MRNEVAPALPEATPHGSRYWWKNTDTEARGPLTEEEFEGLFDLWMNERGESNMLSEFESNHIVDENGHPAGGRSMGRGFTITWQNGPLREPDGEYREPNGAFVETVIAACADRIRHYNGTKFKCRENSLAVTKLEEALHWLNWRTKMRIEEGIEGTHEVHKAGGA